MRDQGRASLRGAIAPDICQRCGRCCAIKVVMGGQVLLTPYMCPLLDEPSRLCTVFDRRFELNPWCVSATTGVAEGLWPAECPYASGIPGYDGPRLATADEFEAIADVCRRVQHDILRAANARRKADR